MNRYNGEADLDVLTFPCLQAKVKKAKARWKQSEYMEETMETYKKKYVVETITNIHKSTISPINKK